MNKERMRKSTNAMKQKCKQTLCDQHYCRHSEEGVH